MITIAILLVLGLLGVILYQLFRLQIFSSVYKGSFQKRASTSNRVNAVLFLLFLIIGGIAFFWSFEKARPEFTIPIGSVHGVWIMDMFWTTMIVIGIVFVLTH